MNSSRRSIRSRRFSPAAWVAVPMLLTPLCLMPRQAAAQSSTLHDPTAGEREYPAFRNLSGLAGSGYGVDEEGYGSLSGPIAFSSPVAYVLGRDQVRLVGGGHTFRSRPVPEFSDSKVNGTVFLSYGHSFGPVNFMLTRMELSHIGEGVFNAQIGYVPPVKKDLTGEHRSNWALSAGWQDFAGNGGSGGAGVHSDADVKSKNLFVVGTYRLETGKKPVYLSLGTGTKRFSGVFGSASYQIAKPLRIYAEYDGYGVNEGVLWATQFGEGRKKRELSVGAGFLKTKYFTFNAGVGF